MIDLTKLTDKQRWGLAFAVKRVNDAKSEGETPTTIQEYAEAIFGRACDSYYAELIQYKTQVALEMFASLTEEQQAALIAQLGIPDVLEE